MCSYNGSNIEQVHKYNLKYFKLVNTYNEMSQQHYVHRALIYIFTYLQNHDLKAMHYVM
jgi:hypothetical protein